MDETMKALYDTVQQRREEKQEGSYTCYLFEQGVEKMRGRVQRGDHRREKWEERGYGG